MTFLAPLFVWLLPLALAPVAFHLFFRVRKHPRVFSSLMFFLAADSRLSARRKIRDVLLLVLRVLALILLILALARPVRRGWGSGKDHSVVVLLDNSASMSAAGPDGQTRLSRAQAAAAALLQDGEVRRAALLTTVRDYSVSWPAGLSDDLHVLQAAVAEVRTTHAAGEPARTLREAAAVCRGIMRDMCEIHILTDLSGSGWSVTQPVDMPANASVLVHDVGRDSDRSGNVVIARLRPPSYAPVAGRPWRMGVDLQVVGGGHASEVVIQVDVAGVSVQQAVKVSAGSSSGTVSLALPGLPVGEHPLRIHIEGAAAGPVAEAWWVAMVTAPQKVLLVGEVADTGLLAPALMPSGPGVLTGLITEYLPPSAVASRLTATTPVMVAVPGHLINDRTFAAICRDYVYQGGTVLLFPSAVTNADTLATLPEWTGVISTALRTSTRGEPLLAALPGIAFWDDLRDAKGEVSLRGTRLQKWLALQITSQAKALAVTTDSTVLSQNNFGKGKVYVCGLAWDHRWSNLPRRSVFLPFALALARGRDVTAATQLNLWAGVLIPLAITTPTALTLRSIAGDKLQWTGRSDVLSAPARAGVYRVEGVTPLLTVAVSGDPTEDGVRVSAGDLPMMAKNSYQVLPYQDAGRLRREVYAARRGVSLFGTCLALAALCWALELWLACKPL